MDAELWVSEQSRSRGCSMSAFLSCLWGLMSSLHAYLSVCAGTVKRLSRSWRMAGLQGGIDGLPVDLYKDFMGNSFLLCGS